MRNLPKKANSKFRYFLLALIAIGITGCSDDDDEVVVTSQATGTINVEDQILSGNFLKVTSVNASTSAWLIVKKVNEDGSFSDIISHPVLIKTATNFYIKLTNTKAKNVELEDGDTLALMLYADDGDGVVEIQGNTAQDMPVMDTAGNVLIETAVITSPSIEIENQEVEESTITFTNVSTAGPGWIVVYNSTSTGSIDENDIIGYTYLMEGDNADVIVSFDDTFTFTPGQTVYTRIHQDNPNDEEFTIIESLWTDGPEIFGFGADPTITEGVIIN